MIGWRLQVGVKIVHPSSRAGHKQAQNFRAILITQQIMILKQCTNQLRTFETNSFYATELKQKQPLPVTSEQSNAMWC